MNVTHDVELTLTPALYDEGPTSTLQERKDALSVGCDVSKLNVENTRYARVDRVIFNESSNYRLWAGTSVRSGTTTEDRVEYSFLYVRSTGRVWGKASCTFGVVEYDVTLNPGWNIVKDVFTLDNMTGRLVGSAVQTTIPTGPGFKVDWLVME